MSHAVAVQPIVFDPYSPEMDRDPFPTYRRLRDEAPVFWSPEARMWILSRHEDIVRALGDWESFSSSKGNLMDELPGRAGSTLGSTDPPRHDRLRALVQAAFTKRSVDQLAEPVGDMVRAALDEVGRERFDFIDSFSSKVTVGALFRLMGLPPDDHQLVRRRVVTMIQSDPATRQKGPEHIQAFQDMVAYVRDIVAERRRQPADDLVSRLIAAEIDGDKLAESEIVMTSMTLIMAGVESLSSFLAMFALNLAQNPDARDRVAADPSLVLQAMEESLRLNTSAQRFRRVLMRNVTWHGVTMRAGDFVSLMYGAANRDERKFPNPDTYDIDRRPRDHLGFGGGVHICLGTMMARSVTRIAMTEFLVRMPRFQVAAERLDWNPSTTFRAPVALPLAVGSSETSRGRASREMAVGDRGQEPVAG